MAVYAKKNGEVLAACDDNLLGKKFEEKDFVLDVRKSFYAGRRVEKEELCEMLGEARNINLVGEETISMARKSGLVHKVGRIKGVPYAIIFKV